MRRRASYCWVRIKSKCLHVCKWFSKLKVVRAMLCRGFSPLEGFLNEEEYHSVVENMRMTVSFSIISCPLVNALAELHVCNTACDFCTQSQQVSCMQQSKCVANIIVADSSCSKQLHAITNHAYARWMSAAERRPCIACLMQTIPSTPRTIDTFPVSTASHNPVLCCRTVYCLGCR